MVHDPANDVKSLLFPAVEEETKRLEDTVADWIKRFKLSSSTQVVGQYGSQHRDRSSVVLLRFPYERITTDQEEDGDIEPSGREGSGVR